MAPADPAATVDDALAALTVADMVARRDLHLRMAMMWEALISAHEDSLVAAGEARRQLVDA